MEPERVGSLQLRDKGAARANPRTVHGALRDRGPTSECHDLGSEGRPAFSERSLLDPRLQQGWPRRAHVSPCGGLDPPFCAETRALIAEQVDAATEAAATPP